MKNKHYLMLYLVSIGVITIGLIQAGLALSTGRFKEGNLIGYNWVLFLLIGFLYLLLLIPFMPNCNKYRKAFAIVMICNLFVDLFCIIHDFIVINIIAK